ncbi:MAG TPA: cation transporter [Thermomicrobiales bacterium]|jgi:divalent metal cation (Fe/Co/Zn/Cd) transporter|nr:cation transporter [Thermomicrobiales bacterium]
MGQSIEAQRPPLLTRGLRLEYVTLGWNVVGVIVVAVAALRAQSVALAGFGLDSLIEIFASVVVIWELTGAPQEREERAQSAVVVFTPSRPAPSPLGIVWLAITAGAMFLLAWGKRRTGRQLGNPVLTKEAGVTVVDGLLAVAVLIGLILNAAFGWWWADPLAGLVIVGYGLREGWQAWQDGSSAASM